LARGATIYAEVLGGNVNGRTTWFRNNDSPKSGCSTKVHTKCFENAGVGATEIDTINGHLTTTKDSLEIQNCEALGRKGKEFPHINSLKSMVGHCLSGAGSIESVATVLQL
jgi:3-oxoacyl-(acyl-carrier-protein) synthase